MDQIIENLNQDQLQDTTEYSVDDILSEFWEDYYFTHPDARPGKEVTPEQEVPEDYAEDGDGKKNHPGPDEETALFEEHIKEQRFEEHALEERDALQAESTESTESIENSKNTESAERKKDPIDSASTSNLTEKTGKQEESAETGFQLEQIMEDKPRRRRTSVEKAGRKSRTAPEETGRRAAREIKEEFPDTPPEEPAEPFEDNFDYSSLFHMFAEPPEEEHSTPAASGKDKTEEDNRITDVLQADDRTAEEDEEENIDAILQSAAELLRRKEASGEVETPAERVRKKRTKQSSEESTEEKPLFAEDPGDFRDILRDFMLKDQHPIYADVPGLAEKSNAEEIDVLRDEQSYGLSFGTAADDFTVELPSETAGDRFDEMSLSLWPDDGEAPLADRGRQSDGESTVERELDTKNSVLRSDSASEGETSSRKRERKRSRAAKEDAGKKADQDRTKSSLLGLLRGVGNPFGGKKKALNTPTPYASWEDSLPAEDTGEPEKPEADDSTIGFAEGVFAGEQNWDREEAAEADGKLNESRDVLNEGENPAGETAEGILYDDLDDEEFDIGEFPSFGQWILNELMSFWIKLNGVGDRQSTATMEEDKEDLGPEVNVANASRYYGSQVTMLRMRFQIAVALLAVMAWITLGLPVSGMLKTAKVASAMCLGLQLTVMLLCLDVVTNAAVNLTRGKFGADGLAVALCLITSLDALAVSVGGFSTPHIPLCMFSSLALTGILLSSLLSARALRKAIRVPAIGKRAYCVTAEEGVRGARDITILKSIRPTNGFVRRAEEAPPDETLFGKTAIFQLLAALVLSLLTGVVRHGVRDMLYIMSAILSCSVPFTALLAFALPYYIGTQRIFSSGAALAGWSGVHDIGSSRNLIVTDRDLFPEDAVSIETVRIFADQSAETVIAYAGTMIAASGSGLGPCFTELMENNECRMRQVEDFEWLSGGGLSGRIEGHRVLCGNADVMQLMNVRVPYKLVDAKTVLLAIDGTLCGIFQIRYIGLPEVKIALQQLIASNRHPIFAIRDFNITPDLLRDVFEVATDGYDFPPYGDRFRISEAQPSDTSKVAGVICREGLGPLTHLADTGRSIYVAVRLNVIVTATVVVLGMLLVFLKLIGTGIVSAWLPFVLMFLGLLITALISLFMRF